jgi:hypothetical protein
MASVQSILRRSGFVDTSGAEAPVMQSMRMGGGVYIDNAASDISSLTNGRISLGIIAVLIVGSVGFYYFSRSIQGGG